MKLNVPIASMLELPELVVTGCEGGIEIVMLCELPDERTEQAPPTQPAPAKARPEPA